jgi:tRNA(Ile2)-agmatinylcytidine synthase
MLIGIDDTDSRRGMCTTYLASVLKEALEKKFHERVELRLVRLNPTIPFKTRGNASICICLKNSYNVIDIVSQHIERFAHLEDLNTHPGAVFFCGKIVPPDIRLFARKAMHAEVSLDKAVELIERHRLKYLSFKNGRGLIGALAAIGATFDEEFTYELIAYRLQSNFSRERYINTLSVLQADLMTYPHTWDTVDRTNETIICAPHSFDPILYGIRGDDPYKVLAAHKKIISEPIAYLTLYRTNQGTDSHIRRAQIRELEEGCSYAVTGKVITEPLTTAGGHTFFHINESGDDLTCAAFEPTKQFRTQIRKLRCGDVVTVQGSYIEGCLNLEKLGVIELSDQFEVSNPKCCDKRMKSLGLAKGFKCSKCKAVERTRYKCKILSERDAKIGAYEVVPSARRHLATPLIRNRNQGHTIFPSR